RSLSPQETLGAAVSQATTFESQFFESQTEEEGAAEGSQAGTAATTEASVDTEPDNGDNFDGINWDRLPRFMKPLTTGRRVKSWIFQHGYRVVELYDQNRVWFVCKYCHIHKVIDTGGSGVFDVSKATSSAAASDRNGLVWSVVFVLTILDIAVPLSLGLSIPGPETLARFYNICLQPTRLSNKQ
ncbi:hypothetical protein PtrEW13061_011901, partial [Pyrenophora tritici-repentis]